MLSFSVECYNEDTGELLFAFEFKGSHFTPKMHKIIMNGMFRFACEGGCDAEHLIAYVNRSDWGCIRNSLNLVYHLDTKVDYPTIRSYITIDNHLVRCMSIAE